MSAAEIESGHVAANGVNYYYELHGQGEPVLRLHGGLGNIGMFEPILPEQAEVGAAMDEFMKDTPIYHSYVAVAPDPDEFPALLDAMGEWMRTPYDWSDDVKKLDMPVMLVYGDSDMFRLEHIVDFYHL